MASRTNNTVTRVTLTAHFLIVGWILILWACVKLFFVLLTLGHK
jgi:hypothetical protein